MLTEVASGLDWSSESDMQLVLPINANSGTSLEPLCEIESIVDLTLFYTILATRDPQVGNDGVFALLQKIAFKVTICENINFILFSVHCIGFFENDIIHCFRKINGIFHLLQKT